MQQRGQYYWVRWKNNDECMWEIAKFYKGFVELFSETSTRVNVMPEKHFREHYIIDQQEIILPENVGHNIA